MISDLRKESHAEHKQAEYLPPGRKHAIFERESAKLFRFCYSTATRAWSWRGHVGLANLPHLVSLHLDYMEVGREKYTSSIYIQTDVHCQIVINMGLQRIKSQRKDC